MGVGGVGDDAGAWGGILVGELLRMEEQGARRRTGTEIMSTSMSMSMI